jgi:hypothetical protein
VEPFILRGTASLDTWCPWHFWRQTSGQATFEVRGKICILRSHTYPSFGGKTKSPYISQSRRQLQPHIILRPHDPQYSFPRLHYLKQIPNPNNPFPELMIFLPNGTPGQSANSSTGLAEHARKASDCHGRHPLLSQSSPVEGNIHCALHPPLPQFQQSALLENRC